MKRTSFTLNLFALSMLTAISFTAHALPNEVQHVVVAPKCLIQHSGMQFTTLTTTSEFALIQVNPADVDKLIDAKLVKTKTPCGGFMDVTQDWQHWAQTIKTNAQAKSFLLRHTTPASPASEGRPKKTYRIQYPKQVNELLNVMNPKDIWTDLSILTNFQDRYAGSRNGVKAAKWIKTYVEAMAKSAGRSDISTYFVKTGGYQQPSVVVKVGYSEEPGIVIGGHLDTLSSTNGAKPGADDDGSGSATTLAVARLILNSGLTFKKPIYFVWYAAEEMGLVGSQYVVKEFKAKKIAIDAVIQFDMTGYAYQNDLTMWLINDYVNKDLTAYLETLITTYVKQPVKYSQCGYACSDHASWNQAGYASSFPFESSFGTDNPYIHSSNDTMSHLTLEHITNYAKLGTAFAVELAEPVA